MPAILAAAVACAFGTSVAPASGAPPKVTCKIANALKRVPAKPVWFPVPQPEDTTLIVDDDARPGFVHGLRWSVESRYFFLVRMPRGTSFRDPKAKVAFDARFANLGRSISILRLGDGRLLAKWPTAGKGRDTTVVVAVNMSATEFGAFLASLRRVAYPTGLRHRLTASGPPTLRMLVAMAKKASTPRPPVQAPKRRDTRSTQRPGLGDVPRWGWSRAWSPWRRSSPWSRWRSPAAAAARRRQGAERDDGRRLHAQGGQADPAEEQGQLPRRLADAHDEGEVEHVPAVGRRPLRRLGDLGLLPRTRQRAAGRPQPRARRHRDLVGAEGSQAATVDELERFYQESPNSMLGTPIAGLDSKIALTAWTGDPATYYRDGDYGMGHIATCKTFDEKAFEAFRDAYRGKGRPGYQAMIDAGFTDAWRSERAPDPGFTCSKAETCQPCVPAGPSDRSGPVSRCDSRRRHRPDRKPAGRPRNFGLWPSDHAGVPATFYYGSVKRQPIIHGLGRRSSRVLMSKSATSESRRGR